MLWQLVDWPALNTRPRAQPGRVRLAVAAMAEASAVAARIAGGIRARLRKQPAYFDPDPYASEAPFVSDRWPRQ